MSGADDGLDARIEAVRERIFGACQRAGRNPEDVTLITVSKTFPATMVAKALEAGLRDFGENRVQEGSAKATELLRAEPAPRWHLIGHLQTNKVALALRTFEVIHSVDSERVLEAIGRHAETPVHIFVQVNVAGEASKSGGSVADAAGLIARARETQGVILDGLMTIAPLGSDGESARPVFRALRQLAERERLEQLSMGMSGDFEAAIEEGATHVRIGQAIFGGRQ